MMWDGGPPFLSGEIKQISGLKEDGCTQYWGVGLDRIYLKVLEKLASVIVGSVYGKKIFNNFF